MTTLDKIATYLRAIRRASDLQTAHAEADLALSLIAKSAPTERKQK